MSLNPISSQPIIKTKMKTSKVIFISLLSIIALFILASALDIRINSHRNGNLSNIKVNKQAIPIIKVLCVSNSKNIEIIRSDSTLIKASWLKDSLIPKEFYTIKNDTLMLSDLKRYVKIKIYANDSLKSIQLKKSEITIETTVSTKLSLDLDRSYVWFNLKESDKSSLKTLEIKAKNHSNIGSNSFKIDSLGIILQNSNANLDLHAKKVSGTLSDSSRLNTRQPEEIWMKKDTTCTIYLYD